MHIGLLQAGHLHPDMQNELGDYDRLYPDLLEGQGLTWSVWPVVDGRFPDGPRAADGWLISGSRHGAYENHDWIPPLEDLIRQADAARIPVVGICFGHQIVAQAMGGRVEKFPGGWGVGALNYDWGDETLTLGAWHQDQVVTPPPGARRVATSAFCEHAGFAYGDHMLTMQAHPEFGRRALELLIERRGPGTVPEPTLDAARARLDTPLHSARVAARIGAFLRRARRG